MRIFTRWDEVSSTEETNAFLFRIASELSARINSHTVRKYLDDCIDRRDVLALCNFAPAYAELSVSDCLNVRQICAFFQKRGQTRSFV